MNETVRWLWKVTGKKKWYILLLTVIQAVMGGVGVLYALFLREVVDSAVGKNAELFRRSVLSIVCLVLFQLAVSALVRWIYELAKAEIENTFKLRLSDNILHKEYSSVSSVHTAEWLNRLTSDTAVVSAGCTEIIPGLVGTIVRLFSALIMIIALDCWFAYILIPGGIIMIILTYVFRKVLKDLHKDIRESDGRLRIFLQERFGNLMIIKSFVSEDQVLAEAEKKMKDHKSARMRRTRFSNLCSTGFSGAMQGMYLLGIVYCAYGIMTGRVTYGTLTAIMQLIGQVQAPFANITGYLPRWYAMTASAERLMEAEAFADDEEALSAEAIRTLYQNLEAIGFSNASFTYRTKDHEEMPAVFDDLNLRIQKGKTTAFIGHSGCGKSTALKLLMCMYPLDGGKRYLLTSNREEPLTAIHRRLFAYVPQGNALMNGTIREIVSFSDPAGMKEEERIHKALRIACADEFVNETENGIDTMLGEKGAGLSEGQMQRIAIARAIFSDSPVLLLDEATSALDEVTEKQLLDNLQKLTDRTVILVTHRTAVLSICDWIYRFSEGNITCTEGGKKYG